VFPVRYGLDSYILFRGNSVFSTVQQMWRLLRKTNPSSRRSGDPISKHINGLGKKKNLVMGPGGARNQERLC
jgi:hypothetical protein